METVAASIWQKSKIIVKGLMISVLALLLLIPTFFVSELIEEREQRQKEAVAEVSGKWAGPQNITGPILVIPYNEVASLPDGQQRLTRHEAFFLPEKLKIHSTVTPQERHRGIYKVMLYSSETRLSGSFSPLPFEKLKVDPAAMLWEEAYLCMGISDAKGLNSEMQLQWDSSVLTLNPSTSGKSHELFVSPVRMTEAASRAGISFSTSLSLKGSEHLFFTPVGKETTAEMESAWPDPSFAGSQLPVSSDISRDRFSAKWKSLSHTRKFPQQWIDNAYSVSGNLTVAGVDSSHSIATEAFGAGFFIAVNGYQKTMRSVKYAILCILLTFAAFFIIETINKRSVHPFQYGLIGLALVLFYTLLLSFSEYIGFNNAYILASVATVGLIGWFVKGILRSNRLSLFLTFVLMLMYSYIFTILQIQDYALLLGSVGLFLTLAVIMHFSKKIQW